jgi:hypothetical protein
MSAFVIPELPPDLAAKAAEVPGLDVRLLLFIRQEVALHERRQSRYSAEAREILKQAKADAAANPMTEDEKAEARRTFAERYAHLLNPS